MNKVYGSVFLLDALITSPTLIILKTKIVHALLGLVRSSISTTIMQVASRLLLVWAILENFTAVRSHPAYASMLVAWSVTEMVRYAYYGFNLLGSAPEWITWCR